MTGEFPLVPLVLGTCGRSGILAEDVDLRLLRAPSPLSALTTAFRTTREAVSAAEHEQGDHYASSEHDRSFSNPVVHRFIPFPDPWPLRRLVVKRAAIGGGR